MHCLDCHRQGVIDGEICPNCKGTGVVVEKETLEEKKAPAVRRSHKKKVK
jgi:DnaJ-class molecular chaperone